MRISDWSSDVCSSDLAGFLTRAKRGERFGSTLNAATAPPISARRCRGGRKGRVRPVSLRKGDRPMPALLPVPPSGTRAIFNIHDIVRKKELCMSDSAEKVKKIVVEHLGVEADKVTEEASFIDDLGADSLDIVDLVMTRSEEHTSELQ